MGLPKHKCLECGLRRKCVPVVIRVGGTIEYVCHLCYRNKYCGYLHDGEQVAEGDGEV